MFKDWKNSFGTAAAIFLLIGAIIIILAVSYAFFTLGYWLVTLILLTFFNFVLPFSWWYSLGAWLLWIIASIFLLPSGSLRKNS